MKDDLIRQMGYITLATRLKRISDKMSHSTRLMYKTLNIDIEPNWYLVLVIIKENPKIAVMEIAQHLRFTHQSVISMTNKMISNGYLLTEKDAIDKRKTVFELTIKAQNMLPRIQRIWAHGEQAILELLTENTEIMEHLETLESNLEESSFGERILDKLHR
jgi:DNA-binding MarR family transcriptional regulator